MLVKKLFSFLVCSTFALSVQSQLSAVDYKDEKFISFKASKTFIVKTGNEKFDSELLQAFKDSWNLTPYDVISNEEFDIIVGAGGRPEKEGGTSVFSSKSSDKKIEVFGGKVVANSYQGGAGGEYKNTFVESNLTTLSSGWKGGGRGGNGGNASEIKSGAGGGGAGGYTERGGAGGYMTLQKWTRRNVVLKNKYYDVEGWRNFGTETFDSGGGNGGNGGLVSGGGGGGAGLYGIIKSSIAEGQGGGSNSNGSKGASASDDIASRNNGNGGNYGGGGGGHISGDSITGGSGGKGAVRIMCTISRSFPYKAEKKIVEEYTEKTITIKGTKMITELIKGTKMITELIKGTKMIPYLIKGTKMIPYLIKGNKMITELIKGTKMIPTPIPAVYKDIAIVPGNNIRITYRVIDENYINYINARDNQPSGSKLQFQRIKSENNQNIYKIATKNQIQQYLKVNIVIRNIINPNEQIPRFEFWTHKDGGTRLNENQDYPDFQIIRSYEKAHNDAGDIFVSALIILFLKKFSGDIFMKLSYSPFVYDYTEVFKIDIESDYINGRDTSLSLQTIISTHESAINNYFGINNKDSEMLKLYNNRTFFTQDKTNNKITIQGYPNNIEGNMLIKLQNIYNSLITFNSQDSSRKPIISFLNNVKVSDCIPNFNRDSHITYENPKEKHAINYDTTYNIQKISKNYLYFRYSS